MRSTVGMLCMMLGLGMGLAFAQSSPPHTGGAPVLHEPLPYTDRLQMESGDEPVFVFEEGADRNELPTGVHRDGHTLPAPTADNRQTEGDLLYRTSSSSSASEPGTVHNVEREVRLDRNTGREPWLRYHAVFDPAVIPFKRNSAKDQVSSTGGLVVRPTALLPVELVGNRVASGREVFWGSILVDLNPGSPTAVPSVSPDSRVLSYATVPSVPLQFVRDGADNLYVDNASHEGRVRINFLMDAPTFWFHQVIPADLTLDDIPLEQRPALPDSFQAAAMAVADRVGVRPEMNLAQTISTLVVWFRAFEPGDLPAPTDTNPVSQYVDVALGQKGICRHRSYSFLVTAHALGIPTRYVSNEAHVFVEVRIPNTGWLRVDLGGGALGMDIRNASEKTRHGVSESDPFGRPPGFRSAYSHQASQPQDTSQGADPVRGLPPLPGERLEQLNRETRTDRSSSWMGSPFGGQAIAPRARLFPDDGQKISTRTTLEQVSALVYRGDKLAVRGYVLGEDGPVVGGSVRIALMAGNVEGIARVLGSVRTGVGGLFEVEVSIPADVSLGQWEVLAEFIGNQTHAPSHSD